MSKVLIIDDDLALCRSLQLQLGAAGHAVEVCHSVVDGRQAGLAPGLDLVLLDLRLPDGDGLAVLDTIATGNSALPVVIITGQQEMKAAITAMRAGAFDYLRKPFDVDEVLLALEKAARFKVLNAARGIVAAPETAPAHPREIVGRDRAILELVKTIGLLSRSRVNVLIEGESGTGKELVARALHEAACPDEPFVAVNCSAVVPTLFESELFGHEKGSFTGADARKTGRLEHAGAGTVFLDEIGDLPLDMQAKLLRVLQEREFHRVGGLAAIPFKARAIAATHRDLKARVAAGEFREDLFYRLAVSRLWIPPLRQRRSDIPILVGVLLRRAALAFGRSVDGIAAEAMRRLEAYDWPGNVRELENVIVRAVALAKGPVITIDDLEFNLAAGWGAPPMDQRLVTLDQAVKAHVEKVLHATGWNITRAAQALAISPTTLRKKIADFGLRRT